MVTIAAFSIFLPLAGAFITAFLAKAAPRAAELLGKAVLAAGLVLTAKVASNLGAWDLWGLSQAILIPTGVGIPPFSIDLVVTAGASLVAVVIYGVALLSLGRIVGEGGQKRLPLSLSLVTASLGLLYATDLFNSFVFLEIGSIVTIGLAASRGGPRRWEAAVKLALISGLVTILFLIVVALVYRSTGELRLVALGRTGGLVAVVTSVLMLAIIMAETKAFPLLGWGVDYYHGIWPPFAALYSGTWSLAMLLWGVKVLPLLPVAQDPRIYAWLGAGGLVASQVAGLRQRSPSRPLGYSTSAFASLLLLLVAFVYDPDQLLRLAVLLFGGQALAKFGLFMLAGREAHGDRWEKAGARWRVLLVFALIGLPPFPVFWAKFELLSEMARFWPAMLGPVLLGLFLEAVYVLRFWAQRSGGEPEGDALWPSRLGVLGLLAGGYLAARFMWPDMSWSMPAYLPPFMSLIFGVMFVAGAVAVLPGALLRWRQDAGHGLWLGLAAVSLLGIFFATSGLSLYVAWEISAFASVMAVSKGGFRGRGSAFWFAAFAAFSGYLVLGAVLLSGGSIRGLGLFPAVLLIALAVVVKLGQAGAHLWSVRAYRSAPGTVSAFLAGVSSKGVIYLLMLGLVGLVGLPGKDHNLGLILAWIGVFTALGGAILASLSGTPKKLLAYSSVSQLGYVLVGLGLMTPLGWTAAVYHTVHHFLFKTVLFLGIAGVLYRTGGRFFTDLGGLIKKMPFTFLFTLIAVISYAGVPPLAGFGGKWLLYQGLLDAGRLPLAAVAMCASVVAFLYSFRLLHGVFLGQLSSKNKSVREAPLALILPQFVLVCGIFVMSFRPTLFLERLLPEMTQLFGWPMSLKGFSINGFSVLGPFGHWNAWAVGMMVFLLFGVAFVFYWVSGPKPKHVGQLDIGYSGELPPSPEEVHFSFEFYRHYERALVFLPSWGAERIFAWFVSLVNGAGDLTRILVSGDGRTYLIHIVLFVVCGFMLLWGMP